MARFVILPYGDNDSTCMRALLCHILCTDVAADFGGRKRCAVGDFLRFGEDGAILSVADTR